MSDFTDSTGDKWEITLPFGEVKRIEKACGICLLEPRKDDLVNRLDEDLLAFYDLLQIICEPQATAKGISAEEFGLRMAADCLFKAQRAFFEAWRDFFLQLGRVDRARAVELLVAQKAKALELLAARMKQGEGVIQQVMEKSAEEMEQRLGIGFGKLQALLESPDETTSTNSLGESSPA